MKQKLPFWETPRNLMIITWLLAAIVAAIAGVVGYQAGQHASRQMFPPGTVITFPPGTVITIPAAKP